MFRIKRHMPAFFLAVIALPFAVYSQSANDLLRAGDEYYQSGDYGKAAESWKRALEADPKNSEAKQKLEKLYSDKYKDDKEYYESKISSLSLKKNSPPLSQAKEVTIDWDAVDGATKYLVQIKDSADKLLLDTTVTDNRISFPAPPGNYRMRVGAYNIFDKIGVWSEWTELKVVRRESAEESPFPGVTSHGFMFTAGYLYSFVFSDYSEMYEASPRGWILRLGYQMKRLSMFESIPVLRNMHLECEFAHRYFNNRDSISNYDIALDVNTTSLNIAYVTDFRFPVNFALRLGGGSAYSRQSVRANGPLVLFNTPSKITTMDPCYQFSASVVINAGVSLFIDAGAGILWIDYVETDMKSVSLFCLAGIHI